jgi:protease PrsW
MSYSLLALAIAPSLAIAIYIYWKDKFDKEPLHVLAISFFLGCISVIPAIYMEKFGMNTFGLSSRGSLTTIFFFSLLIGFSEEWCKYIFLIRYSYRHKGFNEPYDGITYAVMVSMGFATVENIMYVYKFGATTAWLRMFTAVPAHATFGIIMGYFVGLAKFNGNSFAYKMAGLWMAIAFHTAYDYFLFSNKSVLIATGAALSLIIGIVLSYFAIRLHNHHSPFKTDHI